VTSGEPWPSLSYGNSPAFTQAAGLRQDTVSAFLRRSGKEKAVDDATPIRKDGVQPIYVPDLRDVTLAELAEDHDGTVRQLAQKAVESANDPHRVAVATFNSAI
jgi:hypothetical protein